MWREWTVYVLQTEPTELQKLWYNVLDFFANFSKEMMNQWLIFGLLSHSKPSKPNYWFRSWLWDPSKQKLLTIWLASKHRGSAFPTLTFRTYFLFLLYHAFISISFIPFAKAECSNDGKVVQTISPISSSYSWQVVTFKNFFFFSYYLFWKEYKCFIMITIMIHIFTLWE